MDLRPNAYVQATLKSGAEELKELQRLRRIKQSLNHKLVWIDYFEKKLIKQITIGN